ncbi:Bicyclomycin resistance protein [Candidatus Rhodobacter oscarellae]|uniref:Bcr/CflA family efflux transporter n=1 Tax=Candidatus Rhodobacter oscarellae TaxID=1675527 RepID=A0A0J9E030_9RHOB|nr:multidrug effflux MFS transporter [Candidatus Rhodobacter lobularis]KMW56105.1 Bicyclomycin resistance protein [Candidatus Rhodobacter lobularis]
MTERPVVRFLDRTTPPHIITLILITGVSVLSMNIFLPSLPGMAAYFDTEYRLIQLSVPVYLAMNAVLQLAVGPISDRYGRRPVLLVGFSLFVLASIGCLLAPNVEVFLAFRMAQASVVVGMALSRAAVRDMVPQDQAASMIGYVTMGMAVVPMIGPAFGGALDQVFGWKANFVLLAALGAAMVALIWADMGETAKNRSASFAEQLRQYPELLSARRFWGYCLTAAFGSGAFFAYLGGAPFVGTDLYGLSSFWLGIYFGAPALGYLSGNFLSGRYSVRFGINAMIAWGTVIITISMGALLLAFWAGLGSAELFFGMMTLLGLGNGMMMPNAQAGMLSVRPHLAGSAAGLGGAIMIGGGAALSALAGALLTPQSGAYPLILIQFIVAALSLASILYVVRRERSLPAAAE